MVVVDHKVEEHMAEAELGQPGAAEVKSSSQSEEEVGMEANNNSGQERAGTFRLSDTGSYSQRHLLEWIEKKF